MRPAKRFSDDPNKSVKVFCNLCDKVVFMSGLRKHLSSNHSTTKFAEYKRLYGSPWTQIIQLVHHKCKLCRKVVLLDSDEMYKHMKQVHYQPYMPYMTKYMKKGSGFVSQAAALLPVSRKAVDKHIETDKLAVVRSKLPKQVSITRETVEVEEKFVQIKCDQCPKTFKQNIQLKIHKKRNHFSF